MELEADNAGITETLEQKCLKEMATQPQLSLNNHKSERRKDCARRKGRGAPGEAASGSAAGESTHVALLTWPFERNILREI